MNPEDESFRTWIDIFNGMPILSDNYKYNKVFSGTCFEIKSNYLNQKSSDQDYELDFV